MEWDEILALAGITAGGTVLTMVAFYWWKRRTF